MRRALQADAAHKQLAEPLTDASVETAADVLPLGAVPRAELQYAPEFSTPPLEVIEGRGVSVRFLQRFTQTFVTDSLAAQATTDAIPFLERKIREIEQQLALGSESGVDTGELFGILIDRYDAGAVSRDEFRTRCEAHAKAAQRRSNKDQLESALHIFQSDLKRRLKRPFVTARDIHKLIIKAHCDPLMCRYCELPSGAAWNQALGQADFARSPRVGDGRDPETREPDFGLADFFLSYNWDTPWDEVLDALVTHSEEQAKHNKHLHGVAPPFYWMDIFAVNQHNCWECEVGAGCPGCAAVAEDLHNWSTADPNNPKGFERVIAHTKRTVMLMEPWDMPRPPTRVWCLFEGNRTLVKGGTLEVVLGRSQRRQMQKALEERFDELEQTLNAIDARRAQATVEADRSAIFGAVEMLDSGFDGLNGAMRSALRRWLAEAATDVVERTRLGRAPLTPAEILAEGHTRCSSAVVVKLLDRFPRLPQGLITAAIFGGALAFVGLGVLIFAWMLYVYPDAVAFLDENLFVFLLVSSIIIVPGSAAVIAVELRSQHETQHMTQHQSRNVQGVVSSLLQQTVVWVACGGVGFAYQLIYNRDSEAWGSDRMWFYGSVLAVGIGSAVGIFVLGVKAELWQADYQLPQGTLFGVGLATRTSDYCLPGLVWAVALVGSVVCPMLGAIGVFVAFGMLFGGVAIAKPLIAARKSIIARGQLGVKAGWVRLRLGEMDAATSAFQAAHDELAHGVGSQSSVGWAASPGLVRALTDTEETAQAQVLIESLDRVVAQAEHGSQWCKRVFCSLSVRFDVAHWHVLRAGLQVARRAPDAEVLSLLEEAAAGGHYNPPPRLPHWDEFVHKMTRGGEASEADRSRWEDLLDSLAQNQSAVTRAHKRKLALVLAGLFAWFCLLAYLAIGKLYCAAAGTRPRPPPMIFTAWCI